MKEESPKKGSRRKKIVDELVVVNIDEANKISDQLKKVGKFHYPTKKNKDCLFEAYLSNLNLPKGYDVMKFHRQIAGYGVKNADFFHDKIHVEGESLESYFRNLASGKSSGDKHTLELISLMWNTRITVLSPHYPPIKIWHSQDVDDSHCILVWNGNNHYVGTRFVEDPQCRLRSVDNTIHVRYKPVNVHNKTPVKIKSEPLDEKASVDKDKNGNPLNPDEDEKTDM